LVEKPHKTALRILDLDDESLSKIMAFPATKRELLDKLQVRLMVFEDRIEVVAVFPVAPIDYQKCNPTRGIKGVGYLAPAIIHFLISSLRQNPLASLRHPCYYLSMTQDGLALNEVEGLPRACRRIRFIFVSDKKFTLN
jgi:hypothetical protein